MKNEIFAMFKYPSMIKSMAFCAALFAMLSVLLKNSIVLIPEVTEVRVCNIIACSFGIWFGPAGAWGCAIGNLIGDLGGSLTILTLPGFVGNFLSAWLPYKIWSVTGSALNESPLERPSLRARKWGLRYAAAGFCSVASCSAILAFSFDFTAAMPAANTYMVIFLNNLGATVLGAVLFIVMCLIPKPVLRYWRSLMTDELSMTFPARHRKKLWLLYGICAAITVFVLCYALILKLDLQKMDAFGQPLPIAVSMAVTAALIVVTFLCGWRQTEEIPLSES